MVVDYNKKLDLIQREIAGIAEMMSEKKIHQGLKKVKETKTVLRILKKKTSETEYLERIDGMQKGLEKLLKESWKG